MCGRFTLRTPTPTLVKQFELSFAVETQPRYNIAPTQPVAAVRVVRDDRAPSAPSFAGEPFARPVREMVWLRWGLIPSWANDPSIASRLINARAETVAEKPAFRNAFKLRRCIVVADGYFEWRKEGTSKQPYWIRRQDDQPFALAALWESWSGKAPHLVDPAWETCTLITTPANDFTRSIHDRMPAILPPSDWNVWLDPEQSQHERLNSLLRPYPFDDLRADPVRRTVNNPRHEGPECVQIVTTE